MVFVLAGHPFGARAENANGKSGHGGVGGRPGRLFEGRGRVLARAGVRAAGLLDDVGEFVGEQVVACGGAGPVCAVAEDEVGADGVGAGAQGAGGGVGGGAGVGAHGAEVVAEA
nr:hypothetical protein [Nocardia colli]